MYKMDIAANNNIAHTNIKRVNQEKEIFDI